MDDVRIISPRVPFTVSKTTDRESGFLSREGYTFLRDALNGLSNRINFLEMQLAQEASALPLLNVLSNRINFLEMQLAQEASALPLLAETVKAGTYLPTLFNTTNVTASTAHTCQYVKLQSIVLVSGRVIIQPTAAGAAATTLGMSIPIPSIFTGTEMLGGSASSNSANQSAAVQADTANNRANVYFSSVSTANLPFFFTFAYQIR